MIFSTSSYYHIYSSEKVEYRPKKRSRSGLGHSEVCMGIIHSRLRLAGNIRIADFIVAISSSPFLVSLFLSLSFSAGR